MNSNLLKIFNEKLTDEEKQWYQVLAGYLISRGRTAELSAAALTKELVNNEFIGKGAEKNKNPAERFLKKLTDLKLIDKISTNKKAGRKGNTYTLNFYFYSGQALEGVVPAQHPLYIKRNADSTCEECLTSGMMKNENRVFLKIKSPRYTGKTSLLIRLREFAKEKYAAVGLIDLEHHEFSDELFIDGESNEENKEKYQQFLETFQGFIEEEFNSYLNPYMTNFSSPKWSNISLAEKFTKDLEEKIFSPIQKPKVLLIDGIDRILGTHLQDPFLRMLRTWFEQKMKMLENNCSIIFPNIIIAFSTESYFDRESPLQNVGTEIELPKFTEEQILDLAELYGLIWDDGLKSANSLKNFLSGNPYLINMALYEMSKKNIDLETFKQQTLFPNSRFLTHLRKIVEKIKECDNLEKKLSHWFQEQDSYLDEKSKIQLAKLGAIEFENNNNIIKPKISCQLYEEYFKQQFLNQNS